MLIPILIPPNTNTNINIVINDKQQFRETKQKQNKIAMVRDCQ